VTSGLPPIIGFLPELTVIQLIIVNNLRFITTITVVTLREEHRLRMFENKVLRRIFGSKIDKVAGEWRKLHNEELHDLYSL
jgi:hypothetical protein